MENKTAVSLKEYLEANSGWGRSSRICIPSEYKNEISTYTRVDENDTKGRTWYKIYYTGTDSKYGAFMVSPDTKEYRNTTMSEFYGGGIVD